MLNLGGGEVLVILLLALIVLGPQRLPDAARQVGKVMGELRRVSNGFQAELKGALDEADPQGPPTPRRDVLGATKATEAAPTPTPTAKTASARPARPSDVAKLRFAGCSSRRAAGAPLTSAARQRPQS